MTDVKTINAWYQAMPGKMIFDMERNMLYKFISQVKGQYLLQMGGSTDLAMVKDSPIIYKYYLGSQQNDYSVSSIIADFKDLPLLGNQINVIVLVHLLEFIDNPLRLLSQIKEALVPNGYLIIIGFNFWSLWNLSRLWQKKEFPWDGHFYSSTTIKRWLRALDMDILTTRTTCFRPPVSHSRMAKHYLFLEPAGQFFFPGMGGLYMMIAQKRVLAMKFNEEQLWWKKYTLGNSYPKPTTRNL